MTLIKIVNDEVVMTKEEEELFYWMVYRFINMMPNVYRKRNTNRAIVSDITYHGSGYSQKICEYLGVDPSGYDWQVNDNVGKKSR